MLERGRAPAALVAALTLPLSACFSHNPATLKASPTGPRSVYVALGADETVGVGVDRPLANAWPQVFFRTALPVNTVFVNFSTRDATVSDALQNELPDAIAQGPTLATVWLNAGDITAGVSPADYESQLRLLVHGLRRGGATRVLVANTPVLDQLPSRLVTEYNAGIARVTAEEGATLVDLYASGPSAATDQTLLAQTFAEALRRSGG